MKLIAKLIVVFIVMLPFTSLADDGFILKEGQGEELGNGLVIKASPLTGTQHSIMVEQTFPKGGTTGLHLHEQGDELFYVVSGNGFATLDKTEEPIGTGDVIFVPAEAIHRIRNMNNDVPLIVLFFMDSPELVDQFRAMHERMVSDPDNPMTPEEFREIETKTGGFKTIFNKN